MAPLWRNKVALDVAADSESEESLSFAGLLSNQDQQAMMSDPGNDQDGQMKKKQQDDEEFEFSCTVGEPAAGGRRQRSSTPSNVHPFGVSISVGNQKPAADDIVLLRSDKKQQPQKNANNGRKERGKKKRTFGRRMFRSFFSPCQECRTQNSIVTAAVR